MTNSDKKDSIRRRMAQTGEPFNVARRKAEAAAAQPPEGGDIYRLIEVEVGSDHDPAQRRHRETFRGRWIIPPDPDQPRTAPPGHHDHACYAVAQTGRERIAVYRWMAGSGWAGELRDYDTLADARLPGNIRRQVAAELGLHEVIHRDI